MARLPLPLSFGLLALFTSPDRAEAIEGDLREEARARGRIWLCSQLIRTACALCWSRFRRSPLSVLALAVCGLAMLRVIYVSLTVLALLLFRSYLQPGSSATALSLLLMGSLAAFLTGVLLVRIAPLRGASAAVGAVLVLAVLQAVLGFAMIRPSLEFTEAAAVAGTLVLRTLVINVSGLLTGSVFALRRRRGSSRVPARQ